MTEAQEAQKKRPAATHEKEEDFSRAIEAAMVHQSDEQVRCMRVFGNSYRCNWWTRGERSGAITASGKITKSEFLRVTREGNELVIERVSELKQA